MWHRAEAQGSPCPAAAPWGWWQQLRRAGAALLTWEHPAPLLQCWSHAQGQGSCACPAPVQPAGTAQRAPLALPEPVPKALKVFLPSCWSRLSVAAPAWPPALPTAAPCQGTGPSTAGMCLSQLKASASPAGQGAGAPWETTHSLDGADGRTNSAGVSVSHNLLPCSLPHVTFSSHGAGLCLEKAARKPGRVSEWQVFCSEHHQGQYTDPR